MIIVHLSIWCEISLIPLLIVLLRGGPWCYTNPVERCKINLRLSCSASSKTQYRFLPLHFSPLGWPCTLSTRVKRYESEVLESSIVNLLSKCYNTISTYISFNLLSNILFVILLCIYFVMFLSDNISQRIENEQNSIFNFLLCYVSIEFRIFTKFTKMSHSLRIRCSLRTCNE